MEYDISTLDALVKSRDVSAIKSFMNEHDLECIGGKIQPKNQQHFKQEIAFRDQRQLIKKILLNS